MGIKRVSAYAAIYFLWGGSYLAIRCIVAVIPPFFAAGIRYTLGALVVMSFSLGVKRQPLPSWRKTRNAMATGIAFLACSYGVVYWAETRLSSWIVAVLVSTISLWTYLGECLVLRVDRLRAKMLLPLIAGLAGMPFLLGIDLVHARGGSLVAGIAVLSGSFLWAVTALTLKTIELPRSAIQTSALQLGAAGLSLFCISCLTGELSRLPSLGSMLMPGPVLAMTYLVVACSAIAFTAFQWLLAHESASLVATSSYVNPIVAMALGILVAHERWTRAQLLAAVVILVSIFLIWYSRRSSEIIRPVADADSNLLPVDEIHSAPPVGITSIRMEQPDSSDPRFAD